MSFPTAALLHCRAPGQINSLVWLHRVVAAVAAQLDLNGKLILGMPNSEHLKMMNKAVSAWHKRRVATCLCCMTRLLLRWAGSALQPAVTATVSGDSMLRPRRGRGGGRRATAPAPVRCTSPPPSDSAPPSPGRTRREVLPGVLHRSQPLPGPQKLHKLQLVDAQLQPVVLPDRLSAARLGPGEQERGTAQVQRFPGRPVTQTRPAVG